MCDAAFGKRPRSRLAFDASSSAKLHGDDARRQPLDAADTPHSRERIRESEAPVTHMARSRHRPREPAPLPRPETVIPAKHNLVLRPPKYYTPDAARRPLTTTRPCFVRSPRITAFRPVHTRFAIKATSSRLLIPKR